MSAPIKVEFLRCPGIEPHWQYYGDGESFMAVGGEETFCDAVKDLASAIEWSRE